MYILIAFTFCLIRVRSAYWKSLYGTDYYLECSVLFEVVITTSQHNLYQQLQPCRSHSSDVMSLVTSMCHCEPGCSTRPVCFLTIVFAPWGIQRQTVSFLFNRHAEDLLLIIFGGKDTGFHKQLELVSVLRSEKMSWVLGTLPQDKLYCCCC